MITRTVKFPETTVAGEPITTLCAAARPAPPLPPARPRGDRPAVGRPDASDAQALRRDGTPVPSPADVDHPGRGSTTPWPVAPFERAPGQLRGPVRPAARADRQAQARRHRGRAVAGHRRVHRAHPRPSGDDWDLDQATEFLVVAATLLDLKAARLLPSAEVEDEEDLALLEARDLLFARLLQYRAFKEVAAAFADRMAARGRCYPRAVGAGATVRRLLPELVLGIGPERARRAGGAAR